MTRTQITTKQIAPFIFLNFSCIYYATIRMVAGSIPDEVNDFSPIYLILPATLYDPGVYSVS
jgi:hypothetical protein